MTYGGLRPVNKLDLLQLRTNAKAAGSRLFGRKAAKTETARASQGGVIKCGMNLVFVGAEVGPWSKTGGLGDVLGGLPPAMAVSAFYTYVKQINYCKKKWSFIDTGFQVTNTHKLQHLNRNKSPLRLIHRKFIYYVVAYCFFRPMGTES